MNGRKESKSGQAAGKKSERPSDAKDKKRRGADADSGSDTSQFEMGYVQRSVRSDITRGELDHLDDNLDYHKHSSPRPYFIDPEKKEQEKEKPPSQEQIRLEKMRASLKESRERVAMRNKTAVEKEKRRRQHVVQEDDTPLHQGKMSDNQLRAMAHRLSVSHRPKTTFVGFETVHDRVDPAEVDLNRLVRRLSTKGEPVGKNDTHYDQYFVKPSVHQTSEDSYSLVGQALLAVETFYNSISYYLSQDDYLKTGRAE